MRKELERFIALEIARYDQPVLIYDLATVRERIDRLKEIEARHNCTFLMAVKSFSNVDGLSLFARCGVGFDLSNRGEWELLEEIWRRLGYITRHDIAVTGPALMSLIEQLPDSDEPLFDGETSWRTIRERIMVNFDSIAQFRRCSPEQLNGLRIGARIGVILDRDLARTEGKMVTRFGIPAGDLDALRAIGSHPGFRGVHCHTGIKLYDADGYIEVARKVMNAVGEAGIDIHYLDLGGGLREMSPEHLEGMLRELRKIVPPSIRILFEFGDYWFEGAGFALARVLGIKPLYDKEYIAATMDISRDCHLRWCDPRLIGDGGTGEECDMILFFGATCHEDDLIGAFEVPRNGGRCAIGEGDILTFSDITGYAASWNTSFNGIAHARVVLYGNSA